MSRYSKAHEVPAGPGDARPTAEQILKDENAEGKLVGKVVVVTGTSSGLGVETARVMSLTGARLFLIARDLNKMRQALGAALLESAEGRLELIQMDHESLASVRTAAEEILRKANNQVNILINNAGVMATPNREITKDGYEQQFQVNHLSHFLLFQLLKPALLASASSQLSSRVVNIAASGHQFGPLQESDNYNFEKTDYNPFAAYGQSKTANIYMANQIDRLYGAQGLHATSLHPGIIHTGLVKNIPASMWEEWRKDDTMLKKSKSVEQGAATTIWAAIGQDWENKGGKYLADCGEPGPGNGPNIEIQHAAYAYHPENEARLWKDSLKLVGLPEDQ